MDATSNGSINQRDLNEAYGTLNTYVIVVYDFYFGKIEIKIIDATAIVPAAHPHSTPTRIPLFCIARLSWINVYNNI